LKTWIKIIVTICVILIISFAIWAFFLREKDEVQAYHKTSELIDFKQSLSLDEKFYNLKAMNYINNNNEKVISKDSVNGSEILEIRRLIISDDVIDGYGDNEFLSYVVVDQYLDDAFAYYMPYTNGNKVKTKSLTNLKNNINEYIKSLRMLNEKFDNLYNYQIAIEGSDVEMTILLGYYQQLQSQYRLCLTRGSDVLKSMMSYIDISLCNDNLLIETKSALYDSFARALRVSSSVELKLEPDYANDLKLIIDRIDKIAEGQNIFNESFSEYDFINSYNQLYNNYSKTLDYIFSCKTLEKRQMADGKSLGNILEGAQEFTIVILNVLGY